MSEAIASNQERNFHRFSRVTLAAALALAACSDSKGDSTDKTEPVTTTLVTTPTVPESTEPRTTLAVVPEANCLWLDIDGRRQPLLQEEPMLIQVDSRCDRDPDAPVTIFAQPEQIKGTSVAEVVNGERLMVDCVVENGQAIQDIRGEVSRSTKWLFVSLENGTTGFMPAVWGGYPDTSQLEPCPKPE